jgi:hypothetical protein
VTQSHGSWRQDSRVAEELSYAFIGPGNGGLSKALIFGGRLSAFFMMSGGFPFLISQPAH